MKKLHEVVFYSGEEPFPACYLIERIILSHSSIMVTQVGTG